MKTIQHLAHEFLSDKNNKYYKLSDIRKVQSGPYTVAAFKSAVQEIEALINSRASAKHTISTRLSIWSKYRPMLDRIARALPSDNYSMGGSRNVRIKHVANVSGSFSNAENYSRGCKYSATHGSVNLVLTAKELRKTKVIGGLITIIGEKVAKDLYRCQWISSEGNKHTHRLIRVTGYLHGDHHFIACDDKMAKGEVKLRREKEVAKKLQEKYETEINTIAATLSLETVFVSVEDSTNAGNCLPGTQNFANKLNIDLSITGAVRADYLYQHRNGTESFVLKAIKQAQKRYAVTKLTHS